MTDRAISRRWIVVYLLVRALVFAVLGLLMLLRPGETVRALAQLLGLVLLVLGAVDFVLLVVGGSGRGIRRLLMLRGTVTVGLGALLTGLTDATITVVAIIAGMQLAVGGGVSVLLGTWGRAEAAAWRGVVVRGVATLAAGAAVIAWPQKSVTVVAVILGVQWLLSGAGSTAIAVAVGSRS